ncbi:MAG: CoA transferase [Ruminococcaceae bacterium]|nr:CoA transferase [Oscillospiraceae bacterium]
MSKPLDGIRVVELADFVSGPVSCRLLSDLGADVIKIEHSAGNTWRRYTVDHNPEAFSAEENPGFDIFNTGKRHIVLNLKTAEGQEIFHRLLATADVFVSNLRLKALERLHLDWESLKDRYPTLIYGLGLGYGEKGPDADKPAFDNTAFWARSGLLRGTAPLRDDYQPTFPPSSMGDIFTAMTLVAEVCAALHNRNRTGRGDYVRSSLFHNGIFAVSTMQIMTQKASGVVYPRSRASMGICSGDYQCKDGQYLFLTAGYADKLLPRVFAMVGREDLIGDPRFATNESRAENCEELHEIMKEAMLTRDYDEWIEIARELDIPMEKLRTFADVSEDEQALVNGYIQDVVYASGTKFKIASSPIEMDSVGPLETKPTRAIGADTVEVLTELGLTAEELAQYRANGIIN